MALGLEQNFRSLLEKARQRRGLNAARISKFLNGSSSIKVPTQAITEHPFFVAMAKSMGVNEVEFFFRYVDVCIDELPANRSDPLRWVLNMGEASGLPVRKELGERRKAAAAMVSSSRNEHIGVSTFLNSIEPIFLGQLCEFLDNPHADRILKCGVQPDEVASFLGAAPKTELPAHAVVMGGAVMDINFLIQDLPQPGASVQANRFLMHPGGKALTQAVACARLGLKTHLVATIGNDPNGQAILAYLEDEGVDTSLVRVMDNELTAVTGVISTRRRDSFAIGWKNDTRLPLPPQQTTEPEVEHAIKNCDFFLCSFEAPTDTVEEALSLAHSNGATTIVTPAPVNRPLFAGDPEVRILGYGKEELWKEISGRTTCACCAHGLGSRERISKSVSSDFIGCAEGWMQSGQPAHLDKAT